MYAVVAVTQIEVRDPLRVFISFLTLKRNSSFPRLKILRGSHVSIVGMEHQSIAMESDQSKRKILIVVLIGETHASMVAQLSYRNLHG